MAFMYFFILALAAANASTETCQTCHPQSQAASILQKESRIHRLEAEASVVASQVSGETQDATRTSSFWFDAPDFGGPIISWHFKAFVLLVVFGSLVNTLASQRLHFPLWVSVERLSRGANKDVIAGAKDKSESHLMDNSDLLAHIEAPKPVTNFLDLLPDSFDVALCRDSSDPEPLTYKELRATLKDPTIASFFRGGDRIALVLQNGREMAVSLLTVMHHACAVPLNPNFTEVELQSSLAQLRCTAIITTSAHAEALAAARQLGLRILLQVGEGSLKLESLEAGSTQPLQDLTDDRPVLLLKTSGTTSKGKVVPFSMRRLSLAAQYNARCVELLPGSVCLSMMPLYHIAGISVNFLASLSAGATVLFFSGQFEVTRFVAELERDDHLQPTWYFAVPAVHEAVLKYISDLGRPVKHKLKLIRSAGATISHETGLKLIEAFQCSLTPAYGMTEALEITCPDAAYKLERPGSVGPSVSAEIKLINGEVCIRGDLVMEGYEHHGDDPDPNCDAWSSGKKGDGYLRTGDLGYLDEDGWLFLTGRSKEMINRGGETINPHEVEPALAKVPGIDLAICFSAPHQALGECIAAAVVLKENLEPEQVQPKDILQHAKKELSDVMQPEVFVYLPKHLLPITATKKFIRAGLAQKLGLSDSLTGQGGAFMYKDGAFTPCDFNMGSKLRDSLGQLREANFKQMTEQRLKDCLFGVGILQVITKHWYEGKYPVDAWAGWFFTMTQIAECQLFTMTLFFMLSGHTASLVTTWSERWQRWMGLYLLMTLGAIEAIWTKSMRVDWFFSTLLLVEVVCVLILQMPKALRLGPLGESIAAGIGIVAFVFLASWAGSSIFMTSWYYGFLKDKTGWNLQTSLTATWGNILMGNMDWCFGNWMGGMCFLWGAAFIFGYRFLPMMSKAIWSHPWLLRSFSRLEVRLMAFLACCWVVSQPSSSAFESSAGHWSSQILPSTMALAGSIIFIGLIAVALGNNPLFNQIGRFSMGALLTHTMFGTKYELFDPIVRHGWRFHDTLQLSALQENPVLVSFFLFALPLLYVLSVGRWAQAMVEYMLLYPAMAIPLWLTFAAAFPTLLCRPPDWA